MKRALWSLTDHAKAIVITVFALPFIALSALVTLAFIPPSNLIATPHTTRTATAASPPTDTTPLDVATTQALSVLPGPTTYQDIDPAAALCQSTLASPPTQLLAQLSTARSETIDNAAISLSVLGYGPGLGALALSNELSLLDSCAPTYATTYNLGQSSAPTSYAVRDTAANTTLYELIVRQGDILMIAAQVSTNQNSPTSSTTTTTTTTTTPTSPLAALATLVKNALGADQATMQSSCVDQSAPLAAAQDNPTQPGFQFPLRSVVLEAPVNWTPPNQSLLSAPLPAVAPYPVGSVTTSPVEPTTPSFATSVTAEIPSAEVSGPGCGWSFSATAVPTPGRSVVVAARKAALAPLRTEYADWPAAVSSYLYALAVYQAKISSYDQWLQIQSSTTTTSPATTVPVTTATTTTTTTTQPPTTTTPVP